MLLYNVQYLVCQGFSVDEMSKIALYFEEGITAIMAYCKRQKKSESRLAGSIQATESRQVLCGELVTFPPSILIMATRDPSPLRSNEETGQTGDVAETA